MVVHANAVATLAEMNDAEGLKKKVATVDTMDASLQEYEVRSPDQGGKRRSRVFFAFEGR